MSTSLLIKLDDLKRAIALHPGRGFPVEVTASGGGLGNGNAEILTALLRRERDGISLLNIDRKPESPESIGPGALDEEEAAPPPPQRRPTNRPGQAPPFTGKPKPIGG